MTFNTATVMNVLTTNKTSLGADDTTRNEVLKEAEARLCRNADDQKEASKMAVETAKLLITIGTAVLVAIGTFVQFARNSGIPWQSWVMLAFATGAISVLSSMIIGFGGISRIYKRAEGRIDKEGSPWSTDKVKGNLNWQGNLGILSLLLLVTGLGIWAVGTPSAQTAVSVTMSGTSSSFPANGPLTIEGSWTSLKLRTAAGQELTLPPQSQPIALICR